MADFTHELPSEELTTDSTVACGIVPTGIAIAVMLC